MEKLKNKPELRFHKFDGEWSKTKLGKLIVNNNSGIYKKSELYGTGSNIIGVGDLYSIDSINGQEFNRVPLTSEEIGQYSLKKGDLIYGESSLVREGIAKTLYVTEKGEGTCFAWHTRRYNVDKSIVDSAYLYYFLSTSEARKEIMSVATQTALTGITTTDYFNITVKIPELEEQTKISSFFIAIDKKISELKQKKTLLEQYKNGAMQKIFSQEIRFKDDNGQEFPKWEKKRLDNVISNFIVPMRDKPKDLTGDIPWCRIEDFNGKYLFESRTNQGVSKETIQKMNLKVYPFNTLIVSCSANLGFCAIVKKELVTNQTFIGLVPKEDEINVEFLFYAMVLSARKLNSLSSGTTISYLSREQFEKFTIITPSLPEQTKIANLLSAIDDKINHTQKQIKKAEVWKKGLMQKMFV